VSPVQQRVRAPKVVMDRVCAAEHAEQWASAAATRRRALDQARVSTS
jgi:hypothetical protein